MAIILEIILLLIFITILVKSSDYFVEYSSRIAKKLGITELVIGLTLVALGTSLPELISSIFAATLGNSELILGNILGSNVANIALILGVGSLLISVKVTKKSFYQNAIMLLLITSIFTIFISTSSKINIIEGIILSLLFIIYNMYILQITPKTILKFAKKFTYNSFAFFYHKKRKRNDKINKTKNQKNNNTTITRLLLDFLIVIISGIGIYIGAKYTVEYGIIIATTLNVPESIIGFTLIALGTSLPELSVTISSAKKGLGDIILGNIIGSNIANMLIVGGISAIITPIFLTQKLMLTLMITTSILLIILFRNNFELTKKNGIMFLIFYIISIFIFVL